MATPNTKIVANLSGKSRRATLHGREYLVAPLTLIVPGVLNGSKGPLYYPIEEIEKDYSAWNGTPIVVYHPISNGQPVSARSPGVLEKQGIGTIFNASVNGKLVAEGWFDVEATRNVDNRVLMSLEKNEPIELSTGLFTENEEAPDGATFNGVSYKAIARNYKPDHLAVLPDQVGACSLKDGCGVLVNEGKSDMDKRFTALLKKVTKVLGIKEEVVENEQSHEELRCQLNDKLAGTLKQSEPMAWIVDVFDDYFVYAKGGTLYRQGYSVSDDKAELSGEPKEVMRKTEYVTMAAQPDSENSNGGNVMNEAEKKVIVDELITNGCCWKETDRTALMGMSDLGLNNLKQVETKRKEAEAVAEAAKAGFASDTHKYTFNVEKKTWDSEIIKKEEKKEEKTVANENKETVSALSDQDKEDLAFARQIKKERKDQAIAKITANKRNKFTKEQLETMGLDVLGNLAELAAEEVQATLPVANFAGASAPIGNVGEEKLNRDDVLPLPKMDWTKQD